MTGTPAQPALQPIQAGDAEARSLDLVSENVAKLRALFPELVTEGPQGASVNVDVLKQLVGDRTLTDADEKYGLTWHGKRQARQLALTPSTGTLRPSPEDSVDWDTTQNLMIEGDNLEVLKLLQKSYAGKVKLIYIDPPYNTGKDFVYPDNFQDGLRNYLELTGQVEGGKAITSNPESSGRFHTDWLNMLYPRLKLASSLLSPDGVIFISLDEKEVPRLRQMGDDIFGDDCFVSDFVWVKKRKGSHLSDLRRSMTEYIVAYAKSKSTLELYGEAAYSEKLQPLAKKTNAKKRLTFPPGVVRTQLENGTYAAGRRGGQDGQDGGLDFLEVFNVRDSVILEQVVVEGPFVWTQAKLDEELRLGSTVHLSRHFGLNVGRHDQSSKFKAPSTLIDCAGTNEDAFEELAALFGRERVFQFAKPSSLVGYLCRAVTFGSKDALVLDFFAGSGTTGQSVAEQNAADGGTRRYILVQLPEPLSPDDEEQRVAAEFCDKLGKPRTIAELTKERLRRAGAKLRAEHPMFQGDLGFRVFKLDTSNLRTWDPTPADVEGALFEAVEHVKPDRSEADVLYEVLLKLGLDLCVPIERREVAGLDVHAVGGGVLFACLAKRIEQAQVEALGEGIGSWRAELAPEGDVTCVFRDAAFADDVVKTNLAAILQQRGVAKIRSL